MTAAQFAAVGTALQIGHPAARTHDGSASEDTCCSGDRRTAVLHTRFAEADHGRAGHDDLALRINCDPGRPDRRMRAKAPAARAAWRRQSETGFDLPSLPEVDRVCRRVGSGGSVPPWSKCASPVFPVTTRTTGSCQVKSRPQALTRVAERALARGCRLRHFRLRLCQRP